VSKTIQAIAAQESTSLQMYYRKRVNLAVVQLPKGGHSLDAPPIVIASTNTIDFCCGSCGEVLMHADDQQVEGVLLHCAICGGYNSTGNLAASAGCDLVAIFKI